MAGCVSDAEARDGSGSFYERSTGTKHTFILENGGKNGYYFKQTKEDLERIRKNTKRNSFADLINKQKVKKSTVAPKKPSTDTKNMSAFEAILRKVK